MPEPPNLLPIASQPLSVVLLAHNAGSFLDSLLASWFATLDGLQRDYEVMLVDDGSTDRTGERAEALKERYSRLQVFCHPTHQGEGAALRTAFAAARLPLLFYARFEPRYRPADLPLLLKEIDKVHLVSGYRAGRPLPLFWRAAGLLWRGFSRVVFGHAPSRLPGWLGWKVHAERLLARAFFGVRNQDVACPYRLLRREGLVRIFLQSNGLFAHVELLAKANFLGLYLAEEVPLGDRNRPVKAEPLSKEEVRQLFAEGTRVFKHPDFGPVRLVEEKAASPLASPEKGMEGEGEQAAAATTPSSPNPLPDGAKGESARGASDGNG
jgi:glycosyltransferase involved in cell wall biosynthesis